MFGCPWTKYNARESFEQKAYWHPLPGTNYGQMKSCPSLDTRFNQQGVGNPVYGNSIALPDWPGCMQKGPVNCMLYEGMNGGELGFGTAAPGPKSGPAQQPTQQPTLQTAQPSSHYQFGRNVNLGGNQQYNQLSRNRQFSGAWAQDVPIGPDHPGDYPKWPSTTYPPPTPPPTGDGRDQVIGPPSDPPPTPGGGKQKLKPKLIRMEDLPWDITWVGKISEEDKALIKEFLKGQGKSKLKKYWVRILGGRIGITENKEEGEQWEGKYPRRIY